MALRTRAARGAVAVAATLGLVTVGTVVAPMASAGPAGTSLRVAITDNGMYVDGPTSFPAGRVRLTIDAAGGGRGIEIIRMHRGYTWHEFKSDLRTAFSNLFAPNGDTKAGLAALNHAINHTTSMGGLYAPEGKTRHGAVLLSKPSRRYILFDDSGNLPKRPVHLSVGPQAGPQTLPASDATVFAKSTRRWGGADTIPAHGNLRFENHATNSPHFVVLQHVKEGTTRKQVIDSFSSNQPPTFILPGEQDSDVLSPGHAMVMHTNIPAGAYALMCFFPDPETGMPHAFMGMVKIIHAA